MDKTRPIRDWLDALWRSPWTGAVLLAIFWGLAGYWAFHTPSPGKAVAALAVVATVMTFRGELTGIEKTFLTLVLFVLVFIEIRAIDNERADNEKKQRQFFQTQQAGFNGIATQANLNFDSTTKDLSEAINGLSKVMGTTQDAVQISAESLNKLREKEGALIPENLPTPPNPCSSHPAPVYLYLGGVGVFASSFPHSVITLGGATLFSIDMDKKGHLQVSADIFDDHGDLVTKIDHNHFQATYAASHIEKSPSRLTVYGRSDNKVLDVEYLNKTSIRISGDLHSRTGTEELIIDDQSVRLVPLFSLQAGTCFGGIVVN